METVLASLTPPGKAAIATIAVRGPDAWAITRQHFTPTLPDEPIADITRGVLDGHVVLDRGIAERGRFPAIDVRRSVSRR